MAESRERRRDYEVDCLQLGPGQNDVSISLPGMQVNDSMESMVYNDSSFTVDGSMGYNNVNGKSDEYPSENLFGSNYQYTIVQQPVVGNATEGGTSSDAPVMLLPASGVQNTTSITFPSRYLKEMTISLG